MELPYALREALELALRETSVFELSKAAETVSQRYRSEVRDGRWHVSSDLAAKAYIATRMPAPMRQFGPVCGQLSNGNPSLNPVLCWMWAAGWEPYCGRFRTAGSRLIALRCSRAARPCVVGVNA